MKLLSTLYLAALFALAGGCATVKLAETQCGAKGELRAAALKVAAIEATALVCTQTGSTVEQCEEAAGASVAAAAVANGSREANDVLRCAAALISDAGKAKSVTPVAALVVK
jgi:hypothetical protein